MEYLCVTMHTISNVSKNPFTSKKLQIINSMAIWKCYTSKLMICGKYVSVTEYSVFQKVHKIPKLSNHPSFHKQKLQKFVIYVI